MACGDLRADTRFVHRHNRVGEANHIHALFKHAGGKFLRHLCIIKHDGNDRVGAFRHIEAELAEFRAEIGSIFVHLIAQGSGLTQHIEHFQARCANCRGKRVGKQIRAGTLAQKVDNFLPRGSIAAAGAAKRLTQCAGNDVHAPHYAAMLVCAAAVFAHEADCVAVIHHHERAKLVRKVADRRQIGDKAIHGKYTIGRNEFDPAILSCFELCTQVCHVVVFVTEALCLAEPHAVNDACVVQLIGNHSIFRPEKRFKQAAVCVKAGRIENRVIHSQEICDLAFQLLVDILRAANEADGGEAEAPGVVARLCGFDQRRMIGEAEVIVCAHVEHAMCFCRVDARLLRRGDDTLIFEGSRRADGLELVLEKLKRLFHKKRPS